MNTKKYKVAPFESAAVVVEAPTGLVIAGRGDTRSAKQLANKLNGGNGFNGYTPPFFLNKWSPLT